MELEIVLDGEQFEERYTDAECEKLIVSLFPNGFSGDDVVAEIAPEGWERSALYFVFHPTPEQIHQERVRFHRNLRELQSRRAGSQPDPPPEPTIEDVRAIYQAIPCNEASEIRELVAMCLWDVFSDGNEVVARDGRVVDLGSWRGTTGFLAEYLNRQCGVSQYDEMNFYMGTTIWASKRADLTTVHEMIFRRLKERLLDWRYHFPELHLIDPRAEERDEAERHELDRMRADMKRARREAIEDARLEPVPEIIVAYANIYGTFPHGWPPWEFAQEDD